MGNCKLFGVLNVFDTTPDFIMLVYCDGSELYFRDNIYCTEYKPVPIFLRPKIVPLVNIPKEQVDEEKLFAFQSTKKDVIIRNFEGMKEFFKDFETNEKYLCDKIQLFYSKNQ